LNARLVQKTHVMVKVHASSIPMAMERANAIMALLVLIVLLRARGVVIALAQATGDVRQRLANASASRVGGNTIAHESVQVVLIRSCAVDTEHVQMVEMGLVHVNVPVDLPAKIARSNAQAVTTIYATVMEHVHSQG